MIEIKYKCHCMMFERNVDVRSRPHGADLSIWMALVTAEITLDHSVFSPTCQSETLEYAKIPFEDGSEGIGEKPRLAS